MHGQVARTQALGTGLPLLFAVQGAERLQHRYIAPERPRLWRFRVGLGEAGGVEDHRRVGLIQPGFDLRQAFGFLEAGYGYRQRVETLGLQALAEDVDEGRVPGLYLGAVEQQRRHRPAGLPVGAPVIQGCLSMARVMDQRARQGARLAPGVVALQPAAGDAVQQMAGIVRTALAQVLPQALAVLACHVAQFAQLGIGAVVARHQDDGGAQAAQLDHTFDAVAPVADAAVHRDQDDLGVAQHLLDVEIHRSMVGQLRRAGQAQAGEIRGQLARHLGQQGEVRVTGAEDHQLGRGLAEVGDAVGRQGDAGLGAEQVHGSGLRVAWEVLTPALSRGERESVRCQSFS